MYHKSILLPKSVRVLKYRRSSAYTIDLTDGTRRTRTAALSGVDTIFFLRGNCLKVLLKICNNIFCSTEISSFFFLERDKFVNIKFQLRACTIDVDMKFQK